MTCTHQSRTRDRGQFTCALGLYGGKPWLGNCVACINAGENTPEFAAALLAGAKLSHPPTAKRISGCCDSAENYLPKRQ